MRTRSGWALAVLGVLVTLLGAAVMIVLGPDSRLSSGPHAIETDGIAVVTAPDVISWADVQVDVLAEVPVRKPIFIGVGNAVDVQDFVGRTQRLEVTSFERPWKISTREVDGTPNLPGAPTAVDWWIDSAAGLGGASISTHLTDQTVSIAVLSVGSSNLTGLEVTVAYGIEGGFTKGLALVLLGLGLAWLGLLIRRGSWLRDPGGSEEDDVEEEVVYVYVDDDGVEHEISAEEAAELELEEEVVEVPDVEVPDVVEPEPEPEPEVEDEVEVEVEDVVEPHIAQVVVPGVLTAGQIAEGVEPEPEPEPEPDPEPEPEPGDDEEVVYVYVDEDGVEHEVSAEELAEFEVVDEEEKP